MRYAILTAVSSKSQATPEKVSLQQQEELARAHCNNKGWHETAGPYIIPGHPRTGYVNLSLAERDMPPLRHALDAAQNDQYDVLVIYDFTRLRDLMQMVFDTLLGYRTQLYPITQAIEPVPPNQYDASVADAVMYTLHGASMSSRAEINALRRRRKIGMPGRVKRGLPSSKIPYGYRKPEGQEHNRQVIPVPVPEITAQLIIAKDMFLSGASTPQIARYLTQQNLPTATGKTRWNPSTLKYILTNPYYAGIITYNLRTRRHDPRTRKHTITKNPASKVITAQGAHTPLWTEKENTRIKKEFDKRGRSYTGHATQRLSQILQCPCGSLLWVTYTSWKTNPCGDHNRKYLCSTSPRSAKDHTYLLEKDILPTIARAIQQALQNVDAITIPAPKDNRPQLQSALDGLNQRKENLISALELGTLDPLTYGERVTALDLQLATLTEQIHAITNTRRQTDTQRAALTQLSQTIAEIPNYILNAPAQQVNAQLRNILHHITVHPNGKIKLHW